MDTLTRRREGKRSFSERLLNKLRRRPDPVAPRLRVTETKPEEYRHPPIFVIGCQRSGTSLVRRILDSHSHIACPPESGFIVHLAALLRDRRSMTGLDSMGFDRDEVFAALRSFISSFFVSYATAQDKIRWADKTPAYVDCLPELWDIFGPEARFVLIVRHGLDVAFSLANPDRHYPAINHHAELAGGDRPVGAGMYWAAQMAKIQAFHRNHPEACYELRYERLTTSPEETLKSLLRFLEEPWEPSLLEYNRFEHHAGLGDPEVRALGRIKPNSGRYQAWSESTQKAVREACEPYLSEFGYS
ncbi:MAG: sulfotransferase [Actinomycetota bacterium]|nr:sulfotransferase [Actinomycetota bacterium]